jgi:hypothetical protein
MIEDSHRCLKQIQKKKQVSALLKRNGSPPSIEELLQFGELRELQQFLLQS